jgi:hypothetical protein
VENGQDIGKFTGLLCVDYSEEHYARKLATQDKLRHDTEFACMAV